jgi:hypothetical protein
MTDIHKFDQNQNLLLLKGQKVFNTLLIATTSPREIKAARSIDQTASDKK